MQLKKHLINDFNFNETSAEIHSRDFFTCQYCGYDGLASVDAYWSLHIEHILPKSKYPKLKHNLNNLVISCSVCNQLKDTFDPAFGDIHYDILNKKDRDLLLKKCRKHIFEKRAIETKVFLELKLLLSSH